MLLLPDFETAVTTFFPTVFISLRVIPKEFRQSPLLLILAGLENALHLDTESSLLTIFLVKKYCRMSP